MGMTTKKCPKNKALFAATAPQSDTPAYRSSARDYTHAVATFHPAAPQWENEHWEYDLVDDAAPEGYEIIEYALRNGVLDKTVARVGRRVADRPAGWTIWSFHGSATAADKAGRGYKYQYRVVPVELVEDRR